MNILYILGNGFDKAQKMATGYPDFYKYLTDKVKDESALLGKMKSAITENTELWSDMESGLGEFTSATNNAEEFDSFYFELSEHLQNYLKKQDQSLFSCAARKKIPRLSWYISSNCVIGRGFSPKSCFYCITRSIKFLYKPIFIPCKS